MFRDDKKDEAALALWRQFAEKYSALEKQLCSKIDHPLITEPLEEGQLAALKNALTLGDWTSPVFQETLLPQYALSLHLAGTITFHQFCTVMERWQTFKDFPPLHTYKLLDEAGEFTEAAKNIWLPAQNKGRILKPLDKEQQENLKVLISTLPASEQIFYTTEVGKLQDEKEDSLGNTLLRLDLVQKEKEKEGTSYLIHASAGVFDALNLVRFGIDEYVRPLHRLGAQTVDDIEAGVRAGVRMTALNFPDTVPYGDIHGYDDVTDFEATMHDKYHGLVMSAMPKRIVAAILHVVDVLREETKLKWSKEMWILIDAELTYPLASFKHKKMVGQSNEEMTKLFCTTLKAGNSSAFQVTQYGALIMGGKPTDLFILLLLDMYANPDQWAKYHIEPRFLSERFKDYYEGEMSEIYSLIKDDPLPIQVLKCQLCYYINDETHTRKQNIMRRFKEIAAIIDANQTTILNKLVFKKTLKLASDLVSVSALPGPAEGGLESLPGKSKTTFVLTDNEFFYVNKLTGRCLPITVDAEQREKLNQLLGEGVSNRNLTLEEKNEITIITGFKQPDEKDTHLVSMTYSGKKEMKAILNAILCDDYAARYPSHREKARKKYATAIIEFRDSKTAADEYAAPYAFKESDTQSIDTLYYKPTISNDAVWEKSQAARELTINASPTSDEILEKKVQGLGN